MNEIRIKVGFVPISLDLDAKNVWRHFVEKSREDIEIERPQQLARFYNLLRDSVNRNGNGVPLRKIAHRIRERQEVLRKNELRILRAANVIYEQDRRLFINTDSAFLHRPDDFQAWMIQREEALIQRMKRGLSETPVAELIARGQVVHYLFLLEEEIKKEQVAGMFGDELPKEYLSVLGKKKEIAEAIGMMDDMNRRYSLIIELASFVNLADKHTQTLDTGRVFHLVFRKDVLAFFRTLGYPQDEIKRMLLEFKTSNDYGITGSCTPSGFAYYFKEEAKRFDAGMVAVSMMYLGRKAE